MTDAQRESGWTRLLEEMERLAAAEGRETLTIPAGDAGAVGPESGLADRHGYAYVIPGEEADRFVELFDRGQFPETELYRRVTPSALYLLTVFNDPAADTAIFLAGVLDRTADGLAGCREAAETTGQMYSHLFRADGTHLGSFTHADPAPFFPE